jgi:hypothetical protein
MEITDGVERTGREGQGWKDREELTRREGQGGKDGKGSNPYVMMRYINDVPE